MSQTTTTPSTSSRAGRRTTAALLVAGAVTVNFAFLGLGTAFDYPNVLNQPPAEVLATFHANQWVIGGLFLLMAIGAGLLAPIALRVGRMGTSTALRASVPVGIAAAAVQVIGLLRWPVLVPGLAAQAADPSASDTFDTLNLVLGTVIGETLGYALTAAWTVLVAIGLRKSLLGTPLAVVGIATGIVEPLEVPGTGLANFLGYIVWSAWLIALAAAVLRTGRRSPAGPVQPITASSIVSGV
jgi:hypothetical protein